MTEKLSLLLLVACAGDKDTGAPRETGAEPGCYDDGDTANPDTAPPEETGEPGETGDSGETGTPASTGLSLLDPADGDAWAIGSTHVLTWTRAAPTDEEDAERWPVVSLEWSLDGGETWTALEGEDGASGLAALSPYDEESTFRWELPDVPASELLLRVRDYDDETVAATATVQILPSQEKTYVWEEVTSSAGFAARDGAGALVFDDRMWLLGGWNPSDRVNFPEICNSEVWASSDGLTWTEEVAEAPWEGRHTAGYAVFQGTMWVLGGDPIQGYYQPDAWSSEDGITWTEQVSDLPWGQRVLHHTVVLDDRLYVMGGQTLPQFTTEDEESAFYNDVWASDDGISWTRILEEAPWAPRGMIGGSAVLNGQIFLLGGGTYDTPDQPTRNYYNDVWTTSDGLSWTQQVWHAPWAPRQYHDVASYDDRVWVLEGYDGTGNRSDVWYSADGESWYEVPDTPWPARHASSLFVHDGSLWVVAGNNMTPDVWRLSPG